MQDPLAKYLDYNFAVSFAGEHARDNAASGRVSATDIAPMLLAYAKAMIADAKAAIVSPAAKTD